MKQKTRIILSLFFTLSAIPMFCAVTCGTVENCTFDGECKSKGSGLICVSIATAGSFTRECEPGCRNQEGCKAGYVCRARNDVRGYHASDRICVKLCESRGKSETCPGNLPYCKSIGDSTCVSCLESSHCQQGEVCKSNTCVPKEETQPSEREFGDTDSGVPSEILPEIDEEPKPLLKSIEGDGTVRKVSYHGSFQKPNAASESTKRIQLQMLLRGENLDSIEELALVLESNSSISFTKSDGLKISRTSPTELAVSLPKKLEPALYRLEATTRKKRKVLLGSVYFLPGEQKKCKVDADCLPGTCNVQSGFCVGEKGEKGEKGGSQNANSCLISKTNFDSSGNTVIEFQCGNKRQSVTIDKGEKGSVGSEGKQGDSNVYEQAALDFLSDIQTYITIDTKAHLLSFSGVNVQINNGSGNSLTKNGFGNFLIGPEHRTGAQATGSHNLVMGSHNEYKGTTSLIAGQANSSATNAGSILGGRFHKSTSDNCVSGPGQFSTCNGEYGVVLSGGGNRDYSSNKSSGKYSVVISGAANKSNGDYAVVLGGAYQTASGSFSAIFGGSSHETKGEHSVIEGGNYNKSEKKFSVVSGGIRNQALHEFSTISGRGWRKTSKDHEHYK